MRPPEGERAEVVEISIHASRTGCDNFVFFIPDINDYFNPRIPHGMRRFYIVLLSRINKISIHASRTGCDHLPGRFNSRPPYFNPRIPHGMRRIINIRKISSGKFQSTHPARDATSGEREANLIRVGISIHASRTGCDFLGQCLTVQYEDFNPRIPHGMRLPGRLPPEATKDFNPRIPHGMRQ